jgi:5' nucleotidase, deoxy (Pyrimidine), cytosolic type C protein (NT5C)
VKNLRLGLDMDEVVMDFYAAFRQEVYETLHKEVPKYPTTWEIQDGWGLTKKETDHLWNKIKATKDWFYLKEPSLPDAVKIVQYLTYHNTCYFITSRPQTLGLTAEVQACLQLETLGVRYPQVIVSRQKGLVAAALELDAFIDDKWQNCRDVSIASPKTKVFLKELPQSDSLPVLDGWTPVKDLIEFSNKIKEL